MNDLPDQGPSHDVDDVTGRSGRELMGAPRWVKVFVIVAIVLAVLVVIVLLAGGGPGGHGPGRHMSL